MNEDEMKKTDELNKKKISNFEQRNKEFDLLSKRIIVDIAHYRLTFQSILTSAISLIGLSLVALITKPILLNIVNFCIFIIILSFLLIFLIHFFYRQNELNLIIYWFNVIWFTTELNLDSALILYGQIKVGMKNFKYAQNEQIDSFIENNSKVWIKYRLLFTFIIALFPFILFILFIPIINEIDINYIILVTTMLYLLYYIPAVIFLRILSGVTDQSIENVFEAFYHKEIHISYEKLFKLLRHEWMK